MSHLWYQVLEAGNYVGALKLLVITKATSNHHDRYQGDSQVQLMRHKIYYQDSCSISPIITKRSQSPGSLLTLSKLARFPLASSIPKAMKQMLAATHIRHCSPPANCLANLTYSGVPFGGLSAFGPSLSNTWLAKLEVNPCGCTEKRRN